VHHRAAGEIEARDLAAQRRIEQSTLSPYHMRHGKVDEQAPQDREQQHSAEFHALGERAGDQCRRDDGEHELIDHEGLLRDGRRIVSVGSAAQTPSSSANRKSPRKEESPPNARLYPTIA
jgi:hypothetical protein